MGAVVMVGIFACCVFVGTVQPVKVTPGLRAKMCRRMNAKRPLSLPPPFQTNTKNGPMMMDRRRCHCAR